MTTNNLHMITAILKFKNYIPNNIPGLNTN